MTKILVYASDGVRVAGLCPGPTLIGVCTRSLPNAPVACAGRRVRLIGEVGVISLELAVESDAASCPLAALNLVEEVFAQSRSRTAGAPRVKAAMKSLTPEVRSALRLRSSARDDTRWVLRLAVKSGWQEANRRYLEAMREQGVEEMSALMKDLGVEGSLSDDEALDVLEAAVAVYLPEAEVERSASERGLSALTIRVRDCPTYARIERSGWHGVTACGSWHRRKGWYQALGIYPADTVVGEKKWGDEACVALVELPRPTRRGPTLIQPPNARQQGG